MFFEDIETERLILKNISMDDREFVFRHFQDPDVCRYLFDEEPFTDISEADGLIRFYTESEPRAQHRWIIVLKESGARVGTCGFHRYDRQAHRAEAGYDLRREFWGMGIMTEAMRAALARYFDKMELDRLDAHIYEGNAASIKLAERLGFAFEGDTLAYTFRGVARQHLIYTLRREA